VRGDLGFRRGGSLLPREGGQGVGHMRQHIEQVALLRPVESFCDVVRMVGMVFSLS